MEIQDKHIVVLSILLLIVVFYTLFVIYDFMPYNAKCQIAFDIINKCGCVPDQNIADLLKIKDWIPSNITITP